MKKTQTPLLHKVPLWCFILTLILCNTAFAQNIIIAGLVSDQKSGAPLSGASVTVKGTTKTVATNDAGSYTIEASPADVLVITYAGRIAKEVKVGNAKQLNVQLAEDIGRMEEVVVIGYGTQKKKLLTGANLQVKGDDIAKQSTTNVLQGLQGQAPGVQITTSSGQPGSGLNVVIRGKGTINNYSPLYIVDGVYTGDIAYLNPADIESIDVLKDAASAAIYGSQAANGVVLVTTRQGKTGQSAKVTLDAFYGWQNAPRKAQLLDAKQYATIMNEAAVNSGKNPYFTNNEIANLPVNTNWLDEMFVNNAPTQNYVLGVQGGSAATVYSLSVGYTGQAGIVGGKGLSNFERYTFRLNTEHSLYNKVIKIGQHLTYTDQKNNGIGVGGIYSNTLRSAFGVSPFVPMYDANGNFYDNSNSTWNPGEANPYAEMYYNNQNRNNNQRLFGDAYVLIEPIKGLRWRSSIGVNYGFNEGRSYTPIYKLSVYSFNDNTRVFQSMGRNRSLQYDNLLSYSFNVKEDHSFDVMAGTTAIKSVGSGIWGGNRDLVFSGINYAWLTNATNRDGANISIGGSPYEESLLSYFGRLQYNYKEKYLFNATFRADGSSKFAPGHRWGYFPSVSAGWVLSKEDFMVNNSLFNFFKLRASWGQVGNQSIAGNQFLAPISFNNTNYTFGNQEGVLTSGAFPSRLGNPAIKWETSEQLNIGFDATIKGKLNINFDYYIKNTKDWLLVAPVPATAGADAPFINGGDVKNTGLELALSYRSNFGKFNYSIGLNGAYNKNTVGSIPTPDQTIHGNTNSLYNNSGEFYRAQNGFPVGYFWGLKTDGVFQSEAELAAYAKNGVKIQPNAAPGDVRYIDLNNDGVINDADRTLIGNPNPDFTFGFTLAADYKGFDISILASGVAGNELVQSWRNHADAKANYSAAILDRWHGPGSSNRIPRVTEDNRNWTQFSDLYIHKGDFLRINNITLGYDFSKLVQNKFISKVRLYGAVLNLHTFTKYNGMDPEIGYGEGFSSGVDLGFYPRARTYMIGANIKF
ncbi:MAG TPA: TonB-dependent receptor [Ferruginibacter sp.]|nr:TonB-dependent receptor [Ferruginibacter sp.]HMP21123.1 TonB-dependent receptor [Ferruginibacter sp.]